MLSCPETIGITLGRRSWKSHCRAKALLAISDTTPACFAHWARQASVPNPPEGLLSPRSTLVGQPGSEAPLGLHSLPGQFDPVGLEPQTPSSHRFATRENNCYSHYIVYHPRVQGRNPGRLQGVRGVQRGPRGRIETPPGPSGLSGPRNLLLEIQSQQKVQTRCGGHSFHHPSDGPPPSGGRLKQPCQKKRKCA